MPIINHPIVLLSFNRLDYFAQVLASLKGQHGVEIVGPILLFQDGAVSEFSGQRYALDEEITASINLFRAFFPMGDIHASGKNLGVARNFDRAERYVFETLGTERAYFFEDDLVLGPHYLRALDNFADVAFSRSDVGYVTVYGAHHASVEMQKQRLKTIIPMGHNWGFSLSREQWRKSAQYVDQYVSLVRNMDYRDRPAVKIVELFHSWGVGAPGTSQDVAKALACHLTGGLRLNTYPVFGRYIGERGLHTTPESFAQLGFGATQMGGDGDWSISEIPDAGIVFAREEAERYVKQEFLSNSPSA